MGRAPMASPPPEVQPPALQEAQERSSQLEPVGTGAGWLIGPSAILAFVAALVAGLGAAALAPLLTGLRLEPSVRWAELGAAGLGALAALALAPSGPPRPRGALRLAVAVTLGGLIGAAAPFVVLRQIGVQAGVAVALVALGCSAATAVVTGLLGWRLASRTVGGADIVSGLPLRPLLLGTAGVLGLAAWSFGASHVLGHRLADAEVQAEREAHDVLLIVEARLRAGAPVDRMSLDHLAPSPGAVLFTDSAGRVLRGVGADSGEPAAELAKSATGLRSGYCTIGEHRWPCVDDAVSEVLPASRILVAVAPRPLDRGIFLGFLLAGVIVVGAASLLGLLLGLANARELDRVADAIDLLRRSTRNLALALDQPLVPTSLDEVGQLTAALSRLRAYLRPMLDDYRTALERAQAADKARDEFLALVSIELRSPLNEVIAATQLLLDDKAEPLTQEQRDDVATILSASRHLNELIDEVLDVSAIATGQIHLRLGEVDFGKLVTDVANLQRPIVQKKGVEIRLELGKDALMVVGDEKRLRQVITNIVSNAVKFTEKGSIQISVHLDPSRVALSVRDTGPGIPPDALPKLFREFVQLGSIKQRAGGTGLGLAICKRLVEAHGGTVIAESTLGSGSTFRVTLPIGGPHPDADLFDDTPIHGVPART